MTIVGDAETRTITITNEAGTAADPTDLTLEVKNPAGTTTTYTYSAGEITKSATGVYYKTIAYSMAGWWFFEWQATGAIAKVYNAKQHVEPQLI